MKRKFYLHRINAPLDTDHVIYRLWVGESVREQRLLTRIMAWAFQTGATVMSWREDIDMYLQLESERVFPSRGLLDFGFIQTDITAAECVQLIDTKSWDIYEKTLSQPKVFFQQLSILDPMKAREAAGRSGSSLVLTEKSKNLSHPQRGHRQIIQFK